MLTTTGARSGKPHTAVLGYYPDTTERLLVVGAAGGGPKHPDWSTPSTTSVLAEVDELITTLTQRLDYEEEQLVPLLD